MYSFPYRALILDFDDTIVPTRAERGVVLKEALRKFGHKVDDSEIDLAWGQPFPKLLSMIAPGLDLATFVDAYAKLLTQRPARALKGVIDLLELFKSHYCRVIVVTSTLRILAEADLRATYLLRFIDMLWAADDSPYWKPDPRVLDAPLAYLTEFDVPRERTLFVGDSLSDLAVARARNLAFKAVLTGSTTVTEFRCGGVSAEDTVENLSFLARQLGHKPTTKSVQ